MFSLRWGQHRVTIYSCLFGAARMFVGATAAIYILGKGVSVEELAYLKAFQAALIILLDMPSSFLADTYGRRMPIVMSAVCALAWLLITIYAKDFLELMIAEAFNALSLALSSGALTSLLIWQKLQTSKNDEIRKILGHFGGWTTFAMGIAGLLGALLFELDQSWPWWVASATMGIVIATSLFLLPDDSGRLSESNAKKAPSWQHVIQLIGMRDTLPLASIIVGQALIYQIIIQFWQVMIHNPGESNGSAFGVVFVCMLMVQSVASFVSGSRLGAGRHRLSFALIAMIAVSALAPLLSGHVMAIGTLMVVDLFVVRLASNITAARLHSFWPDAQRATCDSAIATVSRVLSVIALPIFGWLFSKSQEYAFPAFTMIVLLISTGAAIWPRRASTGLSK